jgi:hypothetical protein
MTATLAKLGYGSLFQTSNNDSPLTWTAMSEVRSISLPGLSRDVIDASHESAPNGWREVLTGLLTAGDFSVECNFIKTTYSTLFAELSSTTIKARRIVFPGGTFLEFNAYLISLEGMLDSGAVVLSTAKFRPSGQPTLTVV